MKQTLIKIIDDHYVMVNDSEIKEGDWVVGCTRTVVQCMYPENVHHRDVKKITYSTQPIETFNWMGNSEKGYDTIKPLSLQEIKELIGKVDVEKKAEESFPIIPGTHPNINWDRSNLQEGFITGYNQALEDNKDKKYTEEDLRNAYRHGTTVNHGTKEHFNSFIQSFQSKTEWEVTFDEQSKLRLV